MLDHYNLMARIGFWTTVAGLLNGMIGGGCLTLPVVALGIDPIVTTIACLIVGAYSFYTGYLLVLHMGEAYSIKQTLLYHFDYNPTVMRLYGFMVGVKCIFFITFLFKLTCEQISGLLGEEPCWVGIGVAVTLILLTCILQRFNLGEETIALGILSIALFVGFIGWVLLSALEPSHFDTLTSHEGNISKLISLLMVSFILHSLLPQNIIKNPNRDQYPYIMLASFVICLSIYLFALLGGSAGITARVSFKAHPQTVEDYFSTEDWQVTVLRWVYLVHLYSVIPYVIMVTGIRFKQAFNLEDREEFTWKQVSFIACMVGLAYVIYISGVYLDTILSLYGSIFGFLVVILMPVLLHFYCVFWSKQSGSVNQPAERNMEIKPNECKCRVNYMSTTTLYLETVFLSLLFVFGLVAMCYNLIDVISS